MNIQVHGNEIHSLLTDVDELRFHQQFQGVEPLYRALETTTATLARLERRLDDSRERKAVLVDLGGITRNLLDVTEKLAPEMSAHVQVIADRIAALGVDTRPRPGIVAASARVLDRMLFAVLVIPAAVKLVASGMSETASKWFARSRGSVATRSR